MKKLLIATYNKGKVRELKEFLSDLPLKFVSLADLNIKKDVGENEKTYEKNSQKKALFFAKLTGLPAIADDGGIEINAIGGGPGIKSNRWLGSKATDEMLIQNMIRVAKKLPAKNRTAYFKTVVSLSLPKGKVWSKRGEIKGIIAKKPFLKRSKGYPYRSFFYLPKIKKYYHEKDLSKEESKLYNHRYRAVLKLKPLIKKYVIDR